MGFVSGSLDPCLQERIATIFLLFKHTPAVSAAILKELLRGHTTGPFHAPPFSLFHCSPLGAVPKNDNTISLILDLSAPVGFSLNDGIPPEMFSVRYSSFDSAVSLVRDMVRVFS